MATHIGLIGGGNITDTHARAALAIPGVKISAIYGTYPERTLKLCQEYGGTPYVDMEKFLAHQPMSMVIIGSPSGLHAEHGMRAARRGMDVLTEKPIDISTARADAFIEECEKAGVKLGVLFQDRTKPDVHRLKSFLAEGALGKPILADAQVKWYRPPEYYGNSRWRGKLSLDGGGALMNQGVHTVDLLLWLMGDVVTVQARMATALHKIEGEDTVIALLEFASGAMGTLVAATSAYPGYPRRLELTGSEGTVILEHDRIIRADLKTPHPELLGNASSDQNQSATSAVVSDVRGHQALIEDFLRAIKTNTRPACDGKEGRRSVALIEAIYESARSGERVSVS
jgi:UDP-N-acetyl-2-amino-2-deoxyglucuronate dehydrogenase